MVDLKKICTKCKEKLPTKEFHNHKGTKDKLSWHCRGCVRDTARKRKNCPESKKHDYSMKLKLRKNNRERYLWYVAKHRAKKKGICFEISHEDIFIPDICPLLGIPLDKENCVGRSPGNPSIDRKNPLIGYTKENIWIVSHKANSMKFTSDFEEFATMYHNWKKILGA